MKKSFKLLVFTLIFSLTFSATAAAVTTDIDESLPDSIDLYVKMDPANINDAFAAYYKKVMEIMVVEEIFDHFSYKWKTEQITDEDTYEIATVAEYIANLWTENELYFVMEISFTDYGGFSEIVMAFAVEISEEDYNENVITPYIEENSTITEMLTTNIYEGDYIDGAMAYLNGYLFIADTKESLENIIVPYELEQTGTLAETEDFINAKSKFYEDSFFDFYFADINTLLLDMFDELFYYSDSDYGLTSLAAIQSITFSVSETSTGYKLKTYTPFIADKLQELGLDYSNLASTSLYKYFPKNNLLYFSDTTNTTDTTSYIMSDWEYQYTKEELSESYDIDLDNLLLMLENEMAILVQDNGELIPAFTIMADLGENETKVREELDKLIDAFWTEVTSEADSSIKNSLIFEDDETKTTLTKGDITIGNSVLHQFTLDIEYLERKNPYAFTPDPGLFDSTITLGTTDDNLLLASNNKNIIQEYGEGLENNAEIAELLGSDINEIGYFDIDNTNEYIKNALTILENELHPDFSDLSSIKEFIDTILQPFHSISGSTTINNQYMESDTKITANIDKMITNYTEDSLETLIDNMFGYGSYGYEDESLELIFESPDDFTDVEASDWYGDNVYYLNTKGIINGYPDRTYKPINTVNRAEFITLVIQTLETEGYLYTWNWYDEMPYSDIIKNSWYEKYVYTAYEYGLLDEIADDTFHPDQAVTRAEAAQVIANIIETFGIVAENPNMLIPVFDDVSYNEWYVDAIDTVYENGVMTGTSQSTFEPLKHLNRAETATVIRNFLEII